LTREDSERIADILAAARRIAEIVAHGREAFDSSEIFQSAAFFNIQVIGEAAVQLTEAVRTGYPDVPWQQVIGMRNFVVHQYFDVDLDVVWETMTRGLPDLRGRLEG
jgi:uncharacterized protein with HEPN domain